MELVFRVAAAAVCAVLTGLLIRRTNPELAALLGIGTVTVILLTSVGIVAGFRQLTELMRESFGLSETYIQPVLKCVAAAILTKLTADLCRDSSQSAVAAAVELAGILCALGILMPLLITMMKTVGGFL